MQNPTVEQLRNIVLLSHGGAGKTSLAESLLFATGAISRMGRVEDGTTTSDYEPEEVKRGSSTQISLLPCLWNNYKINVIDTPGYADFLGEVVAGLRVADGGVVLVAAPSGIEVGTEQVWDLLDKQSTPRVVFVNKMDRENADFTRTLDALQQRFGRACVATHLPIGADASFSGIISLLSTTQDYPPEMADPVAAAQSTDPVVQAILADPVIQLLLANPTALQLLLNPSAQGVLANPVVPLLLADTTVQQLLADPASLQLVVDPRTMRLLGDPTAFPVIQIPVLIHRVRTATGTDGDKISINEQVTTTLAGTDQELPAFPKSNANLVVDRGDKVYLEGTEGGRTDGLAFPFGVDKDVVYPTWVSAARQPLDASYVSTEQFHGLEVYVLKIDVADLLMPAEEGDIGPYMVDSNITIRVEPLSGRVVDVEDHSTTVSLVSAPGRKSTLFVSDIEYTQETVDTQIEAAKGDAKDLRFYGTSLPRLAIGLGILLIILGALAYLQSKRAAAQAES